MQVNEAAQTTEVRRRPQVDQFPNSKAWPPFNANNFIERVNVEKKGEEKSLAALRTFIVYTLYNVI